MNNESIIRNLTTFITNASSGIESVHVTLLDNLGKPVGSATGGLLMKTAEAVHSGAVSVFSAPGEGTLSMRTVHGRMGYFSTMHRATAHGGRAVVVTVGIQSGHSFCKSLGRTVRRAAQKVFRGGTLKTDERPDLSVVGKPEEPARTEASAEPVG